MAVAGPVAEAPALAALGVIAACSVCIALLYAYRATLGALLGVIANAIDVGINLGFKTVHPFSFIKSGVNALDHAVLTAIGTLIAANQWAWKRFIRWNAYIIHETGRVIGDLAQATQHSVTWLWQTHIPQAIARALSPALTLLYDLRHQLAALAATVAHLPRLVTNTVTHETTKVVTHVERIVTVKTQTIVRAAGGTVAGTLPRIGRLERDLKGIDETLKSALRRVSPAVLTGLIVASLARLGLSWARCSRAQRFGKQLCGMDEDALSALIGDTILVLGTVSLLEFAEGMQGLVDEAAGEVTRFWRA